MLRKLLSFFMALSFTGLISLTALASPQEADFSDFPESYIPYLEQLHSEYPNWELVPYYTNIEWSDYMKGECKQDLNLVQNLPTVDDSWKALPQWSIYGENDIYTTTSGSGWVMASNDVIAHFCDPRNFLDSENIFQFELLSFNRNVHNLEGVQKILDNTFMDGLIEDDDITYAEAFMEIGEELDISPYHLASRVCQEQGLNGQGGLICGTISGYEGYYNYFNIKASGKTDSEVLYNGMKYAKENEWDTRYKSLYGGAKFIASSYIAKGQDTLYLQKFDVVDNADGLYAHQYMQNLQAASREGLKSKKAYDDFGMLSYPLIFKIPVFENMPDTASPCPENEPPVNISNVKVQKGTACADFNITNNTAYDINYFSVLMLYENGVLSGVSCENNSLAPNETTSVFLRLDAPKNKNCTVKALMFR